MSVWIFLRLGVGADMLLYDVARNTRGACAWAVEAVNIVLVVCRVLERRVLLRCKVECESIGDGVFRGPRSARGRDGKIEKVLMRGLFGGASRQVKCGLEDASVRFVPLRRALQVRLLQWSAVVEVFNAEQVTKWRNVFHGVVYIP